MGSIFTKLIKLIKKIVLWIIRGYQISISPILGRRCRFQITCSQYSINSIQNFGILKGIWLTFIRILQCHSLALNKNINFNVFIHLNVQDITNMDSKHNFLIIIFLTISFILWQTWKTEHSQEINTKPTKNIYNNIYSSSPHNSKNEPIKISKNKINNNTNHFITIKTDVLLLKINAYGGDIEEAYLIKYLKNLNSEDPFQLLHHSQEYYSIINDDLNTTHLSDKLFDKKKLLYTITDYTNEYITSQDNIKLQLVLTHNTMDGITYIKRYTLYKNSYCVYIDYIIHNTSQHPLQIRSFANLVQSIHHKKLHDGNEDTFPLYSYKGAAYSTDKEKYKKYSFSDIKNTNLYINSEKGWIAMLQKYFVTAWIPLTPENNIFYTDYRDDNDVIIGFKSNPIYIPVGEKNELKSILWIGPKVQKDLKKITSNLDLVIDYGWLWFISQPLFNLLYFIHTYIDNWGVSIIIITLIIRLIMYPLTKVQYSSIAKIRMLQPKLTLIQEKYKHDKYQYHQKTIELYKQEKVNPLGGCLPVFIQMPIFLALYYMLSSSVELRHAKFILWIHDLSAQDPYYILPIFMGVTMFFIQKMSPTTITDPTQKKIMNMILMFFTIFFLWFPSGLVLYYIVSNLITIMQQQIIYHSLKKKNLYYK